MQSKIYDHMTSKMYKNNKSPFSKLFNKTIYNKTFKMLFLNNITIQI